jgi:hypothetical protein
MQQDAGSVDYRAEKGPAGEDRGTSKIGQTDCISGYWVPVLKGFPSLRDHAAHCAKEQVSTVAIAQIRKHRVVKHLIDRR